MTRGNQRDEARLKNAKDAAGKGVKKEGSYLLRKEADSTALADKVRRVLHSQCTLLLTITNKNNFILRSQRKRLKRKRLLGVRVYL
jgi:4F5 protein related disordered region